MSIWELIVIAVGLSMDAFAVSICKGLSLQKMEWKNAIKAGLYFGGFQALMPLTGYLLGVNFRKQIESIDHWVAFVLLVLIGLNMVKESREKAEEMDSSFDVKTMLLLAVATSIDALVVGVSFAFLGIKQFSAILSPIGIIGFVSFALSMVGLMFGIRFGCGIARRLRAELWGGIILVIIGTKILVEHLFF